MSDHDQMAQDLEDLGSLLRTVPSVKESVVQQIRRKPFQASLPRVAAGAIVAALLLLSIGLTDSGLNPMLAQKQSKGTPGTAQARTWGMAQFSSPPFAHLDDNAFARFKKPRVGIDKLPLKPPPASIPPPPPARLPTTGAQVQVIPVKSLFQHHSIELTQESLTSWFNQVSDERAQLKRLIALIPQLGSRKYQTRTDAMKQFEEAKRLPWKALQKATTSSDLEIASRARKILQAPSTQKKKNREQWQRQATQAIFRKLISKPVPGMAEVLLKTFPHLQQSELTDEAIQAVVTCSRNEDEELLLKHMQSDHVTVRCAAIQGLAKITRDHDALLRKLLTHSESQIVLATVTALAAQGDRAVFGPLLKLTASQSTRARAQAIQVLRALTGRSYGFHPYMPPDTQNKPRKQWQQWITEKSQTAVLNLPLTLKPLPEDSSRGLLLHYTFDQDREGLILDRSPNLLHGRPHNQHRYVAGINGKALWLKGSGSTGSQGGHVGIPYIDFSKQKEFSIAIWIKEEKMSYDHGEAYIVFGLDKGTTIDGSLGIAHLNQELIFRTGGSLVRVPFDKKDLLQWVHYAMTIKDSHIRAYKNGKLIGEGRGRVDAPTKVAALGRHWWGGGYSTSTRFIGALDDVRIYNRALTQQQLEWLQAEQAGNLSKEKP